MAKNLELYEKFRAVPESAKRRIAGGKLSGKTDINPMWRIKALTEAFGACGVGWYYTVEREWTEAGAGGEVGAFCDILLYVKTENGEWSKPICGTGGSMLVTTEKGKAVTNDEAFKMARTDAFSVACKQLGVGADVYWDGDATKYTKAGISPAVWENVGYTRDEVDAWCVNKFKKHLSQLDEGETHQLRRALLAAERRQRGTT